MNDMKLIELARNSIISVFEHRDAECDEEVRKHFHKRQGVFVTLTMNGELRGCIGYIEPVFPLWEGIIKAAKAAAFEDARFPKLQKEELKDIKIEISVLSVPKELNAKHYSDYPGKIKIGRHGLIIRGIHGSGLLLPQVFTEHNTTQLEALEMVCQKAFLPREAWKSPDNRLYTFEAKIIKES